MGNKSEEEAGVAILRKIFARLHRGFTRSYEEFTDNGGGFVRTVDPSTVENVSEKASSR